jgi:hypothetical protein
VKALRTYTIEEVARSPILILGTDLVEHLLRRREAHRRTCLAGQLFCLKCRKPQEPAGRLADFVASSATSGALIGIRARTEDTNISNVNCHRA